MATRKDELLEELQTLKQKELKEQVDELGYQGPSYAEKGHNFVMKGDFTIKFIMALGIMASFCWIVWTGNEDAMKPIEGLHVGGNNGNFQLLSVVGPMAGAILQYYFGKSKAGANGE